jgi:HSP20 family molecular chaperone IbpA
MSLFSTLIPPFARPSVGTDTDVGAAIRPRYEVTETPEAYGLTVQLPGVAKDGLEITADGAELRIVGRRTWKQPEGWTVLHRESSEAAFELVLTHDDAIDADKIHADLKDGVLRASLPKAEALKPRKIAVN